VHVVAKLIVVVGGGLAVSWTASAEPAPGKLESAGSAGTAAAIPRSATALSVLPDHGSLLEYDPRRKAERRAAFTYHPVQFSEAHAWKATHAGTAVELRLPDGRDVRIDYRRHEVGSDGNWTWIGRSDDGLDALITFGEKAVFGHIEQPAAESLRFTMVNGQAWLVETDPAPWPDGKAAPAIDDDVLLPPRVASATTPFASAMGKGAPVPVTVDVVLGFTDGFVTKFGGVSQALTRLTNLVALTNQALQASGVTPTIRVVGTQQVAYTDNNGNLTALEALTGITCNPSCAPQAVPAALLPLRDAREQFGADLVSLVRPFRAPQHGNCGQAWLLGGGGFAIDNTDAPFAYSVVSEGVDVDEGSGLSVFCNDQTLAHELAHNMGQAHNLEDSNGSGTHSYAYGYREASSTGFYTIMARRLANSSQFQINHFGNPAINYAATARPTGTAGADNARSLNLSMPLVAQFRAAVELPPQVFADGFEP
jgi:hypothetical protein